MPTRTSTSSSSSSTTSMLDLIDVTKKRSLLLHPPPEEEKDYETTWPIWRCPAYPENPSGKFVESKWWESRPGAVEERCYVVEGNATLTVQAQVQQQQQQQQQQQRTTTETILIEKGDRVVFKKGFSCTWCVNDSIAKHYEYFDASGKKWKHPLPR